MSKIVTWRTNLYSNAPLAHEGDSLFYAEGVVRYVKFTSTFSLKCSLSGPLRYTRGGHGVEVPPGSFLLTNHGSDMECLPNQPNNRVLLVYFTNALVHDVYRNLCQHDTALLDQPDTPAETLRFFEHVYRQPLALNGQLRTLAQQMAAQRNGEQQLLPDLFYHLTTHLLGWQQDVARQISRVDARTPATREELYRRVLLAKDLMHDHWHTDLPLAELARTACLSPFHFHRSFRAAFGQSPGQWLRQLKLEKARELLATGRSSVTEVALQCGFADVFSFSKAFKRTWGSNPSEVLPRGVGVLNSLRQTSCEIGAKAKYPF